MNPLWTPRYSCRDCLTGEHPMKKNQQDPDSKRLWGLKKIPLYNKPKEERILDMVNRMISRIQNDERNRLWRNIHTKLAWECRKSSRTRCSPSVRNIRWMNQVWWDVQSVNSFRFTLRILKPMGSRYSSDSSDITLRVTDSRKPRKYCGLYDPKDPASPCYRVFFLSNSGKMKIKVCQCCSKFAV